MLQRLMSHFQQQTLLGVHLGRFPRKISKNSASKASTSVKNDPQRVVPDSAAATSGEPSSNDAHRSGGTSPTADRPSHRNCHNDSGPGFHPGSGIPGR